MPSLGPSLGGPKRVGGKSGGSCHPGCLCLHGGKTKGPTSTLTGSRRKIFRTETVKTVGNRPTVFRGGSILGRAATKSRIKKIGQLTNNGRWRQRGGIGIALSQVTEVQPAPGTNKGFEKQIPIIRARRTVTEPWLLTHEVKTGKGGTSGENTVIESQNTDGLKGEATQRFEFAKGDSAV